MDIGFLGRRWFASTAAVALIAPASVLLGGAAAKPPPPPALPVATLTSVAATSAGNAWAVGFTARGTSQPVILHWNGRAWARAVIPATPRSGFLNGVAAISAKDAWAVGETIYHRPFTLHWNGAQWSRVAVPAQPKYAVLDGVAGTSPKDVWAVGGKLDSYGFSTLGELALHWNGTVWKPVPVPNLYPDSGAMNRVTALSPSNAWGVGYTGIQASIFHWNGEVWKRSKVRLHLDGNSLEGVSGSRADDMWAVGGSSYGLSLILRWNGTTWQHYQAPRPTLGGALNSVVATSPRNAWAVAQAATAPSSSAGSSAGTAALGAGY